MRSGGGAQGSHRPRRPGPSRAIARHRADPGRSRDLSGEKGSPAAARSKSRMGGAPSPWTSTDPGCGASAFFAEMCILLSRMTAGTARSRTRCTSRRRGARETAPTAPTPAPDEWWPLSGLQAGESAREGYSAGGGAGAGRGAVGGFMAARSCLDHLCSVGPPYFVNQVVQRNLSGPTAFKWSKQIGRVTTCETPSHHARRSAGRGAGPTPPPPGPTGSRVLTTRASRTAPDDPSEPDRPRRPAPADPAAPDSPNTPGGDSNGSSRPAQRPAALNDPAHHTRQTHLNAPEQPPGRGRLVQAGRHRNPHAPRLQNHP